MADTKTQTPPAVDAEKKALVKPEKPNEEEYQASLKKAEKEHADSMARFVRCSSECVEGCVPTATLPRRTPTYILMHI